MKSGYKDLHCGLIGEKLGHSFSPMIHGELADYEYKLCELAPNDVEAFVKNGELDAYNVTIPYKKTVMPFLDVIAPEALAIGAVNTVVRRNGKLYGYNTDYFGFSHMLDVSKIKVEGKKALVFGTGGAAVTVCAVLRDKGIGELVTVSIEDNNSEFLSKHTDAELIVNATPVGMYPNNGDSPIDISLFPRLCGVLDVIYNPARTRLLLDAEARGLPHVNGLPMLVAQAAKAFEFFTGDKAEDGACKKITRKIELQTKNIILIGMPSCGKTTVGKIIAEKLSRPFSDADDEFTAQLGVTPATVIRRDGEERFRQDEHRVALGLCKQSGTVIACGGGIVTRSFNYPVLHQNGTIIFIDRALDKLETKGRPLSEANPLEALYNARIDAYRRFADITVQSTEIPEKTAELIIERIFAEEDIQK